MSKKLGAKDNFRVVVDIRDMGDFGSIHAGLGLFYNLSDPAEIERLARDRMARCEEVAKDIKRHVDNVRNCFIEFDQENVCEHCGATWTENSNTYNGGCCAADEGAEETRLKSIADLLDFPSIRGQA